MRLKKRLKTGQKVADKETDLGLKRPSEYIVHKAGTARERHGNGGTAETAFHFFLRAYHRLLKKNEPLRCMGGCEVWVDRWAEGEGKWGV